MRVEKEVEKENKFLMGSPPVEGEVGTRRGGGWKNHPRTNDRALLDHGNLRTTQEWESAGPPKIDWRLLERGISAKRQVSGSGSLRGQEGGKG